MSLLHVSPKISVLIFKTIDRSASEDGVLAASVRYSGKSPFIDITPYLGDGSSVRTTKSTKEAAGGFSITIPDHPHVDEVLPTKEQAFWAEWERANGARPGHAPASFDATATWLESIYGLVEPMDVVEIRMWSGVGELPPDKNLPIIMRGFVSSVQRHQAVGEDGKPQRFITISGQDYGKIWQIIQILYLPNYAEGSSLLTSYALSELFGIKAVNAMPAHEFIKTAIEKIINPHLQLMLWDGFLNVERQIKTDLVSTVSGSVNISTSTQQGPIVDFLRFHGDVGHWNELFTLDFEDGVQCVYRPTPVTDLSGNKIMDEAPDAVLCFVPYNYVASITMSRSDADVYNFFWVDNSRFDLVSDMTRKQHGAEEGTMSIADYPNSAKMYYGTRPMYASTQQAGEVRNWSGGIPESERKERDDKVSSWLELRRKQLMLLNRDNVVLERGTAKIKGGPLRPGGESLKAGDYAEFIQGGISWRAYIYQIDHEFVPFQGYTTTLHFERGTNFSERIRLTGVKSPWLAEQMS